MDFKDRMAETATAWEKFIVSGKLNDECRIRPEILDSWRRCYVAGVDPYDGTSHRGLDEVELKQMLARHYDLIEVARPFMCKLYQFVAGSGFAVFLSDERGYMMEVMGDPDIIDEARKENLDKGYGWMEEATGTNGIGIVLAIGKPFQVSGPEHYCRKIDFWTCSAAPIFDEQNRIIGALQMSGPCSEAHQHTLGMVVAAVEAISDQLRINRQNRELSILNNSLNNMFLSMSDGAALVDQGGFITKINPSAEQMLGREVIGNSVQELFGRSRRAMANVFQGLSFTDEEVMADTENGRLHCLATGRPIRDETGHISGAIVIINPFNNIKKLTNRFSGAEASFYFEDIVGSSPALRDAIHTATQAAFSVSNVLITGESGTGKELFAQAIHNHSPRHQGPFVALNCAALPRELIASELFGYVEGAFTGAKRGGRPGKFELAAGGTLFLDEIGDMPLDQQATLLRVLQEKKITRLGGDKIIPIDVRVICATNKNLQEEVHKGNFREDLYYRLNVILVAIPPLRERETDVTLLFDHLLGRISRRLNIDIDDVEPGIMNCLLGYQWPGNVRELENAVEKILNRAQSGRLLVKHLPAEIRQSGHGAEPAAGMVAPASGLSSASAPARSSGSRKQGLDDYVNERQALVESLACCHGNVSQVARELGLSRNTVYRKIQFYSILREHSFE